MSINDLTTTHFIAGYKHHPDQEEVYWLSNHPKSSNLIFNKDKIKAFIFAEEKIAFNAIVEILIAENHSWYTPVVKSFQIESPSTTEGKPQTLEQMEAKINELLKLFNERSNSGLNLFLTLNQKDQSIRGYGSGVKIGNAVVNFIALLAIKGIKAQVLEQDIFIIKMDSKKY